MQEEKEKRGRRVRFDRIRRVPDPGKKENRRPAVRVMTNQKFICGAALSFTSLIEGDGDGNAERFQ